MARELEQELVARDQQIGLAARGQNQELLIVRIAAAGQEEIFMRLRLASQGEAAVGFQQKALPFRGQAELRIAGDPFQFGKALRIGKALDPACLNGGFQRVGVPVAKMQQIHHDIGVENDTHRVVQKKL